MDLSDYLVIFALLISAGSLFVSKLSFNYSKKSSQRVDAQLVESEKTELLKLLSDNKSILNKTRIEVGALKADFDIEPQAVKLLLKNYTGIFDYLPKIETEIEAVEERYNEIIIWGDKISYEFIMQSKAAYHEDLKNFEITNEQALKLIDIFKEKLLEAKKLVNRVTK